MVTESQVSLDTSVQRVERSPASSRSALHNWLFPVALTVMSLLLLVLYSKMMFRGLTNSTALDFAQIGRNISAGRGIVTYVLRPLALTHGTDALRQPDMTHGPFFPFLLALAFGAAGARDSVASAVSGLFYILTVPLLYALGLRVFNRAVGLITALAFAFSGLMLEYAVSGLHITLCTFLVTALFLVLYNLAAGRSKKGKTQQVDAPVSTKLLVCAGILTGLLYLTDTIFFWLIPVMIGSVLWITGSQRQDAAKRFLLPLGLLALPWMVRNGLLTGNPIFGLRGTEIWMNTTGHFPSYLAYGLNDKDFLRGEYLIPAVIKKVLLGLNTVVLGAPQISDTWILAFLLPCLLFGYTSRAATALRRVMLSSAFALLVGMLLFEIQMPLFCCFVPTMLVFAIAYLTHLVNQAKLSQFSLGLVITMLGITIVYPVISEVFLEPKTMSSPAVSSAEGLKKLTQPRQIILSDSPEVVAWYADRPSILLPAFDGDVAGIRSRFPDTRWLFLTPQARHQSDQWQYLYDRYVHWNVLCLQAQANNSEAPASVEIAGNGQPLYSALVGFTSVIPPKGSSPSMVIAVLPEAKLSLGTEQNRDAAP